MKSMGVQKSQFLNSLSELGKIWKSSPGLYSKKSIFYLFQELGKIEKSNKSNIQKFQTLLSNGKSLEVQPKTNTQKNPNFESGDELEKCLS